MSQTVSVINRIGTARAIFYTHQTSGACAGLCAGNRMHQMEKTANDVKTYKVISGVFRLEITLDR